MTSRPFCQSVRVDHSTPRKYSHTHTHVHSGSMASKIVHGHSWSNKKVVNKNNLSTWPYSKDMLALPPVPHTSVLRRAVYALGTHTLERLNRLRRVYDLMWSHRMALEVAEASPGAINVATVRKSVFVNMSKSKKNFLDSKTDCKSCSKSYSLLLGKSEMNASETYNMSMIEFGRHLDDIVVNKMLSDMFLVTTRNHGIPTTPKCKFTDRNDQVHNLREGRHAAEEFLCAIFPEGKPAEGKLETQSEGGREWIRVRDVDVTPKRLDLLEHLKTVQKAYRDITIEGVAGFKLIERLERKRFRYASKKVAEWFGTLDTSDGVYLVSFHVSDRQKSKKKKTKRKEVRVYGYHDVVITASSEPGSVLRDIRFIGVLCRNGYTLVSGKKTKMKKECDILKLEELLLKSTNDVAIGRIGGGSSCLVSNSTLHGWLSQQVEEISRNLDSKSTISRRIHATGTPYTEETLQLPNVAYTYQRGTKASEKKRLPTLIRTHLIALTNAMSKKKLDTFRTRQFEMWRTHTTNRHVRENVFTKKNRHHDGVIAYIPWCNDDISTNESSERTTSEYIKSTLGINDVELFETGEEQSTAEANADVVSLKLVHTPKSSKIQVFKKLCCRRGYHDHKRILKNCEKRNHSREFMSSELRKLKNHQLESAVTSQTAKIIESKDEDNDGTDVPDRTGSMKLACGINTDAESVYKANRESGSGGTFMGHGVNMKVQRVERVFDATVKESARASLVRRAWRINYVTSVLRVVTRDVRSYS